MKKIYLIQYNIPNSTQFENRIKALGKWHKHFTNNWIVESTLSAKQIYDQISIGLQNKSILIIELDKSNYWGRMNTSLWDFIKQSSKS